MCSSDLWATVTGATDLVVASYLKSENHDMAKIPYRDPVQALNDAAEGRLHLYWSALAIVRGAIEAGRIKPLAFPSSQRAKTLPNVPTVTEAGFPGLAFDGLVGIYGARDMPDDVRERIAADVKTVLSDPAMVNRLEATGQVVVPGSAKEFAADIAKQQAGVANRAKVLGIAEAR